MTDTTVNIPIDEEDRKGEVVVNLPVEGEAGKTPVVQTTEDVTAGLRQQIADQRAENARLRAENTVAQRETTSARAQAVDSHLVAVTKAIETTTSELTNLEAQAAIAMEAADFKGAAAINRKLAEGAAQLRRLEDSRTVLEERVANGEQRPTVTEGRVEPAPQNRPSTLEELAAKVTPKSAAWLRANPQVMDDPEALAAAHTYATGRKKIAVDSPEYFEFLEQDLGIRGAPSRQEPARRAATLDAPVSRDAPSIGRPTNGRTRAVTLTRAQVDAARAMDMTPEEYAKFLVEEDTYSARH